MGSSMSVLGKVGQVALAIGAPLGSGFAIGLWTAPEVKTWYRKIKKPTWNPPNWLFGPVWSILYVCQGVASYLVFRNGFHKNLVPLSVYLAQLLVNFAWNPLFFKAQRPDLALVDIIALDVLVATTIAQFKPILGAPATAGLLGPYAAWIGFATALNAWIYTNNRTPARAENEPLLKPAGEAAEKVAATAESAKQAVTEAPEKVVEAARDAADKASAAVSEGAQKVSDITEEATEEVAEAAEESFVQVEEGAGPMEEAEGKEDKIGGITEVAEPVAK